MEKIALLIDAENISSSYIDKIYQELEKRGTIIIRRAYADWTKAVHKPTRRQAPDCYNLWEVLSKWYSILAEKGIIAMQQSQNTFGKNSSDIYLVIDAMDMLHEGIVDTFAIVSSDGDFTRLASRLLSGGKRVIVLGEEQTPRSVRGMAEFILLEEKSAEKELIKETPKPQSKAAEAPVQQKHQDKRPMPSAQPSSGGQNSLLQKTVQSKPALPDTAVEIKRETKSVEPKQPTIKKDAANYDKQIIDSISEIIKKHKNDDGEITYQRLLVLLRQLHPDCEMIQVGESPLGLFRKLPNIKYRLDKATYYFSLKEEAKDVKVDDEPSAIAETEKKEENPSAAAQNEKAKKHIDAKSDKADGDIAAEPAAVESIKEEEKPVLIEKEEKPSVKEETEEKPSTPDKNEINTAMDNAAKESETAAEKPDKNTVAANGDKKPAPRSRKTAKKAEPETNKAAKKEIAEAQTADEQA